MKPRKIIFNKLCCLLVPFLFIVFSSMPAMADFQRTKIAVLDFEMIGEKLDTEGMGAILSEWFITSIVKSGRFDVVERAMLQKIIAEQKLSTTGLIDDNSASELGKILGVKVIITGSMLKIRNTVEINSRVIRVESGSIIAAENIRSHANADYHGLVENLTAKIMRNFPLTGYIVKKGEDTAFIDLGIGSGLSVGTEFIVYKEGAVIKHPKTGEVLDVEQILTGRLRIIKVNKNVAIGKILQEEGSGIEYGQLVKSEQKIAEIKAVERQANPRKPTQTVSSPTPRPQVADPVVSLRPQKRKVVTPEPQVGVNQKAVSPTKGVKTTASPEKSGPRDSVAVFPSGLFWDADVISWTIDDNIPKVMESSLEKLDRSRRYNLTNLLKDKRLQKESWKKLRPNKDNIVRKGKEKGFDLVILYYFSFREGQGLVNGWGTDFHNPTFKVFLVDVRKNSIIEKESSTIALDQLFIDLESMTKQVLRQAGFPD